MTYCSCPKNAALPTVYRTKCEEKFGQIQKFLIMRRLKDDGSLNYFDSADTPSTDILEKTTWTALLTVADSTKVVVSPFVQAPADDGGEARTFGGGNETLGGIEKIVGRQPTNFNGVFRDQPQATITTLKELECEDIAICPVDEFGRIEAIKDASIETRFYPIPIKSWFVQDKLHGNLESPDSNNVMFKYPSNYSDNLVVLVPNFNPLTELFVDEP